MPLKLHIAKPLQHAKTVLSYSPTFRALTGTDALATEAEILTATEALIHFGAVEDMAHGVPAGQAAKPYPRAIWGLTEFSSDKSGGSWTTTIQLVLTLEAEGLVADKDKSFSDRWMAWLERFESVVDELKELPDGTPLLNITSVDLMTVPGRQERDRSGDKPEIWGVEFQVGITT